MIINISRCQKYIFTFDFVGLIWNIGGAFRGAKVECQPINNFWMLLNKVHHNYNQAFLLVCKWSCVLTINTIVILYSSTISQYTFQVLFINSPFIQLCDLLSVSVRLIRTLQTELNHTLLCVEITLWKIAKYFWKMTFYTFWIVNQFFS